MYKEDHAESILSGLTSAGCRNIPQRLLSRVPDSAFPHPLIYPWALGSSFLLLAVDTNDQQTMTTALPTSF